MRKVLGSVARAALRCAWAAALFAPSLALAGDSPMAVVKVQGTSYAVFVKDGTAIAVPVPVEVRFVRDDSRPAPPCQEIDQKFASYRDAIQECKLPENASSGTCRSIKDIIGLVRTETGTVGASNLQQGWGVEPVTPAILTPESAVKSEIAAAAGVPELYLSVQSDILGQGDPKNIGVYVKPGGSSLASLLVGFIDVGAGGVSYRTDVHRFVTADHLLACGLLAGDVVPIWEQDAELQGTATSTAQPFTADNLYNIYTRLSARGLGSRTTGARHAVEVGVSVGAALASLFLSDGDIDRKARLVIDTLLEGDDLRLRKDLTHDEIRRILEQASPPPTLTGQLSWKGVEAR